jgi:glyoxylase-like metal-dependent hydrolase (beta-lactamase superfamily II)
MIAERLVLGQLSTNCWIAGHEDGPLIVIDPAGEPARITAALAARDVAAVVLTHGHFDHVGGVASLVEETGAPLIAHEADAADVTDPARNGGMLFGFTDAAPAPDRTVVDGDVVEAGEAAFRVLHTPGHTPGSICLLCEGHLFSGDTVFAGSVGRTDFPGGDGRALRASIEAKLLPLPDDTVVHPGHGPDTTIGRERAVNPFFPRG